MRRALLALVAALVFVHGRAVPAWSGEPGFDARPLVERAQELLDQGRVLDSLEAYQLIARFGPVEDDRAFALVRVADIQALYLDAGRRAMGLYAQAIRSYPRSPYLENAYFNGGMLLYDEGRFSEAGRSFRAYRRHFPKGHRREAAGQMLERIRAERVADKKKPEKRLETGREPKVRVLLSRRKTGELALLEGGRLLMADGRRRDLAPGVYPADEAAGRVRLKRFPLDESLTLHPADGRFEYGGRVYEGALVLRAEGGRLVAVNEVAMERYLLGVVPREMNADFEIQALKAQAVAARSYALAALGKNGHRGYDLTSGEASQVYGGAGLGNALTRTAVRVTRGQVLAHGGEVVAAFFHSHSGGMVEDDAAVWEADEPWYAAREDRVSNVVRPMEWECVVTGRELSQALRGNGFSLRGVSGVKILERSGSGRVLAFGIDAGGGSFTVRGNSLRLMLGAHRIKSTLCDVVRSEEGFVFKGRGFGHGVGMSQWGAQGLALTGLDYRKILSRYYPGVDLARAW